MVIGLILAAALVSATYLLAAGPGVPAASAQLGTCQNSELRTGAARNLPDCRAYEQVSPVDKNGFDVLDVSSGAAGGRGVYRTIGGVAAVDGSRVSFASQGAFGDDASWGGGSGFRIPYLAARAHGAWSTRMVAAHPSVPAQGPQFAGFSADLASALVRSDALTGHPGDTGNLYRYDRGTAQFTLLAAAPSRIGAVAHSADLSHVAFRHSAVLTSEPGLPDDEVTKVYEATGGELRLVSRQPGTDQPFAVPASLGGGGSGGDITLPTTALEGSVSADGRHIFFTAPPPPGVAPGSASDSSIYRRTDGATTVLASPSKRQPADPDGTTTKYLWQATPDGERHFFTSHERLTNDANTPATDFSWGDLYRYDVAADELVNITAATAGDADPSIRGGGVLGAGARGERIYFAAFGDDLVPGEGTEGEPNLYLWEDDGTAQGALRFIATLDSARGDANSGGPSDNDNWQWDAASEFSSQVTADGRYLVFQSRAPLAPGFDPAGTSQVYRYDAAANQGAGELACISCPAGGPPSGDALVPTSSPAAAGRPRFVSEDGRRILFSSPDPLLPRDTNGEYDAYMWEDGALHLLSSGRSSDYSLAFGASADASDALFLTRERLVPQDDDALVDVYSARIGGGLPGQHRTEAPGCQGDGCQGEPSDAPPATAPGSSDFTGPGNPSAEEDPGARSCTRVDRRADRATRKAKRAKQRFKRARRKARRAEGKRERRLERKLKRTKTKAKKAKRKAKRLKRRARRCKRGAE